MVLILNIILICFAMGLFGGRLYELMRLIDPQTGFFIVKGVVYNPYTLILFLVITLCASILVFGNVKVDKPFFARSAGAFSIIAGLLWSGYILISLNMPINPANNTRYLVVIALGALGAITLGGLGIKGEKTDGISLVLLTGFIIGLCLDIIVLNVSTIANTHFLKNALAVIALSLFLLSVFGNVYQPSKMKRISLYLTGFNCFVLCGLMHFADFVWMLWSGNFSLSTGLYSLAFTFMGMYALITSICAIPNGKIEVSILECEPATYDNIKLTTPTRELPFNGKILDQLNLVTKTEKADTKMDKTAVYLPIDKKEESASEQLKDFEIAQVVNVLKKEKSQIDMDENILKENSGTRDVENIDDTFKRSSNLSEIIMNTSEVIIPQPTTYKKAQHFFNLEETATLDTPEVENLSISQNLETSVDKMVFKRDKKGKIVYKKPD